MLFIADFEILFYVYEAKWRIWINVIRFKSTSCFQTTVLETNPYLLAMTVIISIVHSVFEFLAFKNGKFLKLFTSNCLLGSIDSVCCISDQRLLMQILMCDILLFFSIDIQFWKNRKSLEGLSVRSVFFNVFQSLIVVLYVLDNETNFMVKVSVSIGLLIEMWKITKVVTFKVGFCLFVLLNRVWIW